MLEQRASGLGWSKIDFSITSDKANTFISLPDAGLLRRIAGNGMCESPLLPSFFSLLILLLGIRANPLRHRFEVSSSVRFLCFRGCFVLRVFMSPSFRCSLSDSPVSEFAFAVLRPPSDSSFLLSLLPVSPNPFLLFPTLPIIPHRHLSSILGMQRILQILTVSFHHMYISSLMLHIRTYLCPERKR